jgi:hypothetical protein
MPKSVFSWFFTFQWSPKKIILKYRGEKLIDAVVFKVQCLCIIWTVNPLFPQSSVLVLRLAPAKGAEQAAARADQGQNLFSLRE